MTTRLSATRSSAKRSDRSKKLASRSLDFLKRWLRFTDRRWGVAVFHPDYHDEPHSDAPLTPRELKQVAWAESWRSLFHLLESEILIRAETRAQFLDDFSSGVEPVYYEAEGLVRSRTFRRKKT